MMSLFENGGFSDFYNEKGEMETPKRSESWASSDRKGSNESVPMAVISYDLAIERIHGFRW
jgi:hypothetical protein